MYMCAQSLCLSVMSDSVTLWTVACQVPLHEISQSRILEWVAISSSTNRGHMQENQLQNDA